MANKSERYIQVKRQRTEDREQRTEFRIQKSGIRIQKSKFRLLPSVFCVLTLAAGCENNAKIPLTEQIEKLNEEKTQLQKQIRQSRDENENLRERLRVLAGLPEEVKGENLYRLQRVQIGGYTNLYDKDEDGKKEKLIVYIQPIDQDGDIIKAAGAVDVQLWDLSKEKDQALLGQWHVRPNELKKLWFATLMTHYRLTFDVADKIGQFKEPLTVKVDFTDYLTGNVFQEQKVIKPS